jgi:beta-alanine degradation protein BauB
MRHLTRAVIAAGMGLALTPALAADPVPSSNLPVTGLKFFDTGAGPLKAAPAYGDLQKGPHGTYVKMPAGYVSPPHTHTEDYWAVVISGVGANGAAGAADVPLPAGSYWAQRGKEVHVTKCLSAVECIFFVSQSGKFDYLNTK